MLVSIVFIVDIEDRNLLLGILFLIFVGVSSTMIYWYSVRLFDAFMLVVTGFAVCVCFDTWLINLLDLEDAGLLLVGLLIIGQTAGIVSWIRQQAAVWEIEHHEA